MKKKGILILLVSLLILVMIGCRAEEPIQDEAPQETATMQVEQSEQVEPSEQVESSEQDDKVEPMTVVSRDATQEELEQAFESAYGMRQAFETLSSDEDFLLSIELDQLQTYMGARSGTKFPIDIENQYFTWKEANYPKEAEAPATTPEVQAPSNNTQTQPNVNNQTQPANNQTGPGGATIVDDPTFVPGADEAPKADLSQIKTAEEQGWRPIAPGEIEYGD